MIQTCKKQQSTEATSLLLHILPQIGVPTELVDPPTAVLRRAGRWQDCRRGRVDADEIMEPRWRWRRPPRRRICRQAPRRVFRIGHEALAAFAQRIIVPTRECT